MLPSFRRAVAHAISPPLSTPHGPFRDDLASKHHYGANDFIGEAHLDLAPEGARDEAASDMHRSMVQLVGHSGKTSPTTGARLGLV